MRFVGTCYRAHDPRWSFTPLSGEGAATKGGRFNPKGTQALYLSLELVTAIKEASRGYARRIDPLVLCSYDVDCDDIADLTTDAGRTQHGVSVEAMAGAWNMALADGKRPETWKIHERLVGAGMAGALVPSFSIGADVADRNLVLWKWGPDLPHKVEVYDPSGRLPRDQLSWG